MVQSLPLLESSFTSFLATLKGQLYSRQSGSSPSQRSIHVNHQDTVSITLPQVPPNVIDFKLTNSPETGGQTSSQSPELHNVTIKGISPDPFMDLLYLGWNPDLPDPVILNH